MPKSDHRSQMARAWLHFHAARKGRGSGSAAPRVDWPVYPRRAKHNTVAERGIEDGSRLRADPFGLSNSLDLDLGGLRARWQGVAIRWPVSANGVFLNKRLRDCECLRRPKTPNKAFEYP